MAAMRARHRFDDDAGLAMLPCAKDKAVVAPFHIERGLRLLRIQLPNILRLVKFPLHINIRQNRIYKAAGQIGGGCTMPHRRMDASAKVVSHKVTLPNLIVSSLDLNPRL